MAIAYLILSVLLFGMVSFASYRYIKLYTKAKNLQEELTSLHETLDGITGELNKMSEDSLSPEMQDVLTGLPTRKVFEDRLSQTLNYCGREHAQFAVLALDIDRFSEVVKVGEATGDRLLKDLAQRFRLSIRQVDTVARVAGGYFLFLLPHLSRPETAIYVAQRIQDNLLEAIRIDSHELNITVSMGIAIYPIDGTDVETIIKHADAAMHQAKSTGKNKYQFYQSEIHHLGQKELSIAELIRSENLTSRLRIQYHAYFDVNSNNPVYVQAIPHLHHPKYGMIEFNQFRTVAENSGKIIAIYDWLLRSSIQKFQQWHKFGFKPNSLAIPLSLRQLESPHIIYTIREIRKEMQSESTDLVLEVIDDNVPLNTAYLENLFEMLKESNVKAAVGVIALGHFAMQKINKIPLSYLKIDSKLVENIKTQMDKEDLLSKIIELAKDEKIIVMADGIENENQKARLKKLGCELMGGKVFGYLMPTGEVLESER